MNVSKFARATVTAGALAAASVLMGIVSEGTERALFGTLAVVMLGVLARCVIAREELFAQDVRQSTHHEKSRNEDVSLLPVTWLEWTIFIGFGLFSLLIVAAIASNPLNIGVLAVLFSSAGYAMISGYMSLKSAYYHRDRMLLLFGEELGAATILGLLVHIVVS